VSIQIGGVVHVVRNLDAAVAQYQEILGIEASGIGQNEQTGLRTAMFRTGPTFVELWSPMREGPIQRWIDEHGDGGLYLLSFHCDNVPAVVERLRGSLRLINDPGPGHAIDGMVYVHPRSLSGVLGLLYPGAEDRG